jgi:hypothetical protein
VSASWHSAGLYAVHLLDIPVGTLLMEILDHFTLGLAVGGQASEGTLNALASIKLIVKNPSYKGPLSHRGPRGLQRK